MEPADEAHPHEPSLLSSDNGSAQGRFDVAWILVLGLLAPLPYLRGLGFYSDDWWVIGRAVLWADAGVAELFLRIYSEKPRPVLYMIMAVAFKAAGPGAFVFHALNAVFIAGAAAGLYGVLRQLSMPRAPSMAVAITYLFMPQYSATRFWVVGCALNLSLAFAFAALYAALRSVRPGARRSWQVPWLFCSAASLLTYETPLLLLLSAPFLMRFAARSRDAGSRPSIVRKAVQLALTLVPVIVFKALVTTRLREISLPDRTDWFVSFIGEHARHGWITFGLGFPRAAARAAGWLDPIALLFAISMGVAVTVLLHRCARTSGDTSWYGVRRNAWLVACGLAFWIAAMLPFFLTHGPNPSAAGIGNRVVNVATIGTAMAAIGVAGAFASLLRSQRARRLAWSALLGTHTAAGLIVIQGLATWWTGAAREQGSILRTIRATLPAGVPSSSFLVDGICRYHGPAIVFESPWDLRFALAAMYGALPELAGPIGPNTVVEENGIVTEMYDGFIRRVYPFDDLHVLDIRTGTIVQLPDEASARAYFEMRTPPGCDPGRAGRGVAVFGPQT